MGEYKIAECKFPDFGSSEIKTQYIPLYNGVFNVIKYHPSIDEPILKCEKDHSIFNFPDGYHPIYRLKNAYTKEDAIDQINYHREELEKMLKKYQLIRIHDIKI